MITSIQAQQPKADIPLRVASAFLGLMAGTAAYGAGKNTEFIVKDFYDDPVACNLVWNLRAGVPPLVPMALNGILCVAATAATVACGIQAITGKHLFGG